MIDQIGKNYELENKFIIQSLSDIKEDMRDELREAEKEKTKSIRKIHFLKKTISIFSALMAFLVMIIIITMLVCPLYFVFWVSPSLCLILCSLISILEIKEEGYFVKKLNQKSRYLKNDIMKLNNLINETKKEINNDLNEILSPLYNLELGLYAKPKLKTFVFKKEKPRFTHRPPYTPKRLDYECEKIIRNKLIYNRLYILNYQVTKEIINKEEKESPLKKRHRRILFIRS